MLPGETVNKDVYAVNTGTVDAFVKETLSGVLNYTYEEVVNSFAATNVQLTIAQVNAVQGVVATEDGITTYQGGGYLAWTDATGVTPGSINSGRTADANDEENNPGVADPIWRPTTEGVYVFRRSIEHDFTNQNGEHPTGDKFTYAGYYYDGNGKYYKIVLGTDDNRPNAKDANGNFVFDIYADEAALGLAAADVDRETGEILKDVTYKFVKETTVEDQKVTLKYEAPAGSGATATPARLKAEYVAATDETGARYDAKALAAQAQVTYVNALGKYDATVASRDNAKANYDYGVALANAENALWTAYNDLQTKYSSNSSSSSTYDTERGEVNAYAKAMDDGTEAATVLGNSTKDGVVNKSSSATADLEDGIASLKPDGSTGGIFTTNEWLGYQAGTPTDTTNDYVNLLRAAGSAYKNAVDNYIAIYKEIYGNGMDGASGLYNDVHQLLVDIQGLSAANIHDTNEDAADEAKTKADQLKRKADQLVAKLNALKQAYANLKDVEAEVTGMQVDGGDSSAGVTSLTNVIGYATQFQTNAGTLVTKVGDYVTAEDNYNSALDALATSTNEWKAALDKYNTDVSGAATGVQGTGATKTYQDALFTVNNTGDNTTGTGTAWDTHTDRHASEDKSNPIIKNWSAVSAAASNDPTISGTAYTTLYNYDGRTWTLPEGINIREITTMPADTTADFGVLDLVNKTGADRTGATSKTYADWKSAVTTAEGDKQTAYDAYTDAQAAVNSGSKVTFYINLADDFKTAGKDWTFDTTTDEKTEADFYLNKILVGGETSGRLVDSVYFDSSVTPKDYKNLTFDLNVGLDSIQVTYDADQRGYATTAVNNAGTFNMDATVTAPLTQGSAVTWGARDGDTSVTATYNLVVGNKKYENVTITKLATPYDVSGTNYAYSITITLEGESDATTFYCTDKLNGSTFVKGTVSGDALTLDNTVKGTLAINRA